MIIIINTIAGVRATRQWVGLAMAGSLLMAQPLAQSLVPPPPEVVNVVLPISSVRAADGLASPLSLDEAVRLALAQSPQMNSRQMQINAAGRFAAAAEAWADPTLTLGVDDLPIEGADKGKIDAAMKVLGLRMPLENGAIRQARGRAAIAQQSESTLLFRAEAAKVKQDSARAWINAFYVAAQKKWLETLSVDIEINEKTAAARSIGGAALWEMLLPQAERLAYADRLDDWTRADLAAKAALQRYIGDAARRALLEPTGSALFNFTSAQIRAAALNHPEQALYTAAYQKKQAAVAMEKAQASSTWNVGATYRNRPANIPDTFGVQVEMTLPILSPSRNLARIEAADREAEAVLLAQDDFQRKIHAQIEDKLAMLGTLTRQIDRLNQEYLPLLTQKKALQLAQYQGGKLPITMLTATGEQWIVAQLKRLALMQERDNLRAELYFTYLDGAD